MEVRAPPLPPFRRTGVFLRRGGGQMVFRARIKITTTREPFVSYGSRAFGNAF